MAHVEGKVTSYQVINAALNNPKRVDGDEAQSIELGLWKLLMARPDDVSIGHALYKTLQKLPQDKQDALPQQVKDQCAKFKKAGDVATSAVFTMSAPRTLIKNTFEEKVASAKEVKPTSGPQNRGQ